MGLRKYFDFKNAAIGSAIMGGAVYLINSEHETLEALTAGAKQAAYTFSVGGIMMRFCENIRNSNMKNKILKSIIYPTLATASLTYGLHSAKGTPEPVNSTIPTMVVAPIGFAIWQRLKRKQDKLEDKLGDSK